MSYLPPLRAAVAILVLALAGSAVHAAEPPEDAAPGDVVDGFYEAYRRSGTTGLPDPALGRWFSRRLRGLIEAARAEQQRFMAASPDEKPPWIEGDLFSSLFEGSTSSEALPPERDGGRALVTVRFSYAEASSGPPVSWEDTVILVEEEGAWRIDDVAYRGTWDFAPRGTLAEALALEPAPEEAPAR